MRHPRDDTTMPRGQSRVRTPRSSRFGNVKITANLANQKVTYFIVSWNRRMLFVGGIQILGVLAAFPEQVAAMGFEVAD